MNTSNYLTAAQPAPTEPLAHALMRGREALAAYPLPAELQGQMMAALAKKPAQEPSQKYLSAQHGAKPHWLQRLHVWHHARSQHSAAGHASPKRSRSAWVASFASMGAAACLVWLLAPVDRVASFHAAAPLAQFIALPGMANVAASGKEELWMVPMELPKAQLVSYGLPFDPTDAAQRVRAQVLVNAQGQAVAVRFDNPQ
jgi:negative regulator of sigma E activity